MLGIAGIVNGDVCGSNLAANSPLPTNIQIGCGLGTPGTICGQSPVCFAANPASAIPANWTVDARQPYPMGSSGEPVAVDSRQGIGMPNPGTAEAEKIKMTLNTSGLRAISHNCWSVCETNLEQVDVGTLPLSPNSISCIREPFVAGSQYQIELARPISAGQWTTITYEGGGDPVTYASLPGNANGDRFSTPADILTLIDCCINQICTPRYGVYSCDINRDGLLNSHDVSRLTDLLNGAGNYIAWNGKQLPGITCLGQPAGGGGGGGGNCPSLPCDGDPGPLLMMSGGGGEFGEAAMMSESTEALENTAPEQADENAAFADWFVAYLLAADPTDGEAADELRLMADALTQWCVDHFTATERTDLVGRLSDPALEFSSAAGEAEAAKSGTALSP